MDMDPRMQTDRVLDKAELSPLSTLYTLLPDILQRRVAQFPSLRRTASTYATGAPATHRRTWSSLSDTGGLRSTTPPPSYHASEHRPRISTFPGYRPVSAGPSTSNQQGEANDDDIQWDYARQGIFILSQAVQDLTTEAGNRRLGQQLYVDGIKYCLQGMPEDLSSAQLASLRSVLPDGVLPAIDAELVGATSMELMDEPRESMLHFVTAMGMTWTCLMLALVIPVLQIVFLAGYRFERRHRLGDRMLATGFTTVETVSRVGINCVSQLLSMHEGRLKDLLLAAMIYCIRETSDGMYAGLSEGLQRAGLSTDLGRRESGQVREED